MEQPADPSKIPLPKPCWACGRVIDPQDHYCRHCGKGQADYVPWYYSHWGVCLLILGLGPFALYFVWRSPRMSQQAKYTYTAVIMIITWWLISVMYKIWAFYQTFMGSVQTY